MSKQPLLTRRLVTVPALAFVTLTMLTTISLANEQRFTIKSPGGVTPVDNWAFGLSIRNNPTGGGSVTTAVPAGTTDAGVATAAAADITAQTGIKATASGNTLIISQHDQDAGFFFDPLAAGTKFGTSFGGLSGPGGTTGPWGVSRAFRVWAPAPPPPLPPIPSLPPLPQRFFQLQLPPDPLGLPGIFNDLQINLLDVHDELLFSQTIPIEDNADQQQLDDLLRGAFQRFPEQLDGWMVLPDPNGFFLGHTANEWMTGGGIEVLLQPGSPESQMQLILEGEEMRYHETYADFNVDGVVNDIDTAIWQQHYGQQGAFENGDATFDNDIAGMDFLEVQRQFGPVNQFDVAGATAVPEPNTLLLAAAGSLAMLWRRR